MFAFGSWAALHPSEHNLRERSGFNKSLNLSGAAPSVEEIGGEGGCAALMA